MGKTEGYFHRVSKETPTELWINNATPAQAEAALAAGAVGATSNPTYTSRLLKEDPDYVHGLIDEVLQQTNDDDWAVEMVYQRAADRLQEIFHPLYVRSNGRHGYVAIQGNPRVNTDTDAVLEGARRFRQMGENMIIKVPSTPAGARAMETLAAADVPTIGTLCFSVDQAVYMAEAHRRGVEQSKTHPVCYITFIAGILDEHLADVLAQEGDAVPKEWIRYAGVAATRVAYRIYKERGYEAILMGGGARGPHHFIDLVGAEMAITIGWNLAEQLIEEDGPVVSRIHAATPEHILAGLEQHLPDFRKSFREHSLAPEEFCEYGPVVRFQNSFLKGVDSSLKAIAERRASSAAVKVSG